MYEAQRKKLSDSRTLTDMRANDKLEQSERQNQMIATAFNGATKMAKQGLTIYAQSEMRKDELELNKRLDAVEDEYVNVDDPDAYQHYQEARKKEIDSYLEGKSGIFQLMFNANFRQNYEDNSYASFDKKFTTAIYNSNVDNCNKIIKNAERAIVTEEDISKYENTVLYKTVADEDGIHIVAEEVQLADLWDTNLPTDTDDEEQNYKNSKQNDFNRLLNIEYTAYSLVMPSNEAKAKVESRKDEIETNVMLNELHYMGEKYCNGLPMPDGTVKHFTIDEALEQEYKCYKANTPSPYTGRTITPEEEESYRKIIDTVIGSEYQKKYDDNSDALYKDTLGIWKTFSDKQIATTSENVLTVLASYNMIELDDNGKLVSHYGIDDKTWAEIDKIMTTSDRIEWSEKWIARDKEVAKDNNNDGQIDLSDVPDWALDYIATSAKTGQYYVSEKKFYKTLIGDAWFSQTTRAHINEEDKEIRSVIPATEAVKGLMYEIAEYEAYTNEGLEAPASNYVQGLVEQALVEKYGEDWRTKGISTEDYIKTSSQIAGNAVAEFKTNLSKVDKELQTQYSSLYSDTAQRLQMAKKGNVPTDTSNKTAGLMLYGAGKSVTEPTKTAPYKDAYERQKPESMFGAYDYMAVDKAYEAGDYMLIDTMLMKEGKLKIGMNIEDVNALRLAKYKQNEDARKQLLKNSYGYTDDNGMPYASTFELAESRMQSEFAEYTVAGGKFIQESIENYKDATIDRLKLLNVYKHDPITFGVDGLNDMEYEATSISNQNMAVLFGITTFEEGDALSIEQMESIVGAESVKAYKEATTVKYEDDETLSDKQNSANRHVAKLKANREYMELLTVSTNVRLAYRVSQEIYGGEKTYEEVLTQFNLEGANSVFDKLRSAFDHEMSDIKSHPSHTNQTIPSFDSVVKQSNYETEIGDYDNKYHVFKPEISVGDPITTMVKGIASGNSIEFEMNRVRTSSLYSVDDTDKIVDKKNGLEYVLGEFINNPALAGDVTTFVSQFDSNIIKENAWTAIFNAVADARYDKNGNEQRVNWATVIDTVERNFESRLASVWGNWATSENNTSYRTVEFGTGKTLHDDVKATIYGYKLDASNDKFVMAGINNTMNTYFNDDMTKAKFEAGMAGLNDEEMYNYALVCALEANGFDIDGLDPRADDFTDKLENMFPEITQAGIETGKYDARMADYIARCAGFSMYVFDVKSGNNAELVGAPVLMDCENNRFTSEKMNQSKVATQGSYIEYHSREGQLYPSIITNDAKGTVIDMYPFTEQGRKEYEAKINKELEQALKNPDNGFGGIDLAVLFNIAYDNEALKDSSFVETQSQKLLEMCPTMKEYTALVQQAREYITIDFPIFKPWFVGAKAKGEFYNGDWWNTYRKEYKGKTYFENEF